MYLAWPSLRSFSNWFGIIQTRESSFTHGMNAGGGDPVFIGVRMSV